MPRTPLQTTQAIRNVMPKTCTKQGLREGSAANGPQPIRVEGNHEP